MLGLRLWRAEDICMYNNIVHACIMYGRVFYMRLLLLAIGASAFEQWAYANDCGVAFMTQEPSHHYK